MLKIGVRPATADEARSLWGSEALLAVVLGPDGSVVESAFWVGEGVSSDCVEQERERLQQRGLQLVLSPPLVCASDDQLRRVAIETIEMFDEDHPSGTPNRNN